MLSCYFNGHTPHFGFSSEWKIHEAHIFYLMFPAPARKRWIGREHVCRRCKVKYVEIKPFDELTAKLLNPEETK